jgi:hypothetical protein
MRPLLACTLVLAALTSTACRTTKLVSLEQLRLISPDRAWVTDSDQSVVLVDEPKVVGDTLVGYIGRHRTKLPGTGLKQVRVRVSAPARTALLAAGSATALVGFLVIVGGNGQSQMVLVTAGAPGDCDKHPEQPGCNGN